MLKVNYSILILSDGIGKMSTRKQSKAAAKKEAATALKLTALNQIKIDFKTICETCDTDLKMLAAGNKPQTHMAAFFLTKIELTAHHKAGGKLILDLI